MQIGYVILPQNSPFIKKIQVAQIHETWLMQFNGQLN